MIQEIAAFKKKIADYRPDGSDRIAILIKTINRKHLLFHTIQSIFARADFPFRLYIGDDGRIDAEQRDVYELLQKAGHVVRIYDKPIAVTSAFNDLVKATDGEQFLLRMDDDFAFGPETRVTVLRTILQHVTSLGAISGAEREIQFGTNAAETELRVGQGFLARSGSTLYGVNLPAANMEYTIVAGRRFCVVGYTRNFLLIRRSVFQNVQWNEELFSDGEHVEFFLRLAKAGWLVGFTPDTAHFHVLDGVARGDYTGRPQEDSRVAMQTVFLRDYGIKRITKFNFASYLEKRNKKRSGGGVIQRVRRRLAGAFRGSPS